MDSVQDSPKPPESVTPWYLFTLLGWLGRTLSCLGLVCAIVTITHFNIISGAGLIEAISGYITVLFLLWLAVLDAKTYTLPNKLLLIWLGCRMLLILLATLNSASFHIIIDSMLGAVGIFLIFIFIYYVSKRTLGGGDVKLSFVLGLSLTLSLIFTAVFYALLVASIFALIAIISKKMTKKDPLPLCPFLFLGTLISYVLHVW